MVRSFGLGWAGDSVTRLASNLPMQALQPRPSFRGTGGLLFAPIGIHTVSDSGRRVVKSKQIGSEGAEALEPEDLFEMANLFPRTTGLPMTVWVSPRGNARHDVRVKVNMTHGNQMNAASTAVIGVRPAPHVIAGRLSPEDERAVVQWVSLNTVALVSYWDGQIDTIQLGQLLKPLPPQPGASS